MLIFQTKKLFYDDSYQKEFEAKVLEIHDKNLVLDQTCFFPEGGGQVGDNGELNNITVLDTIKEGAVLTQIGAEQIPVGGKIVHILEKEPDFSVGDTVNGKIDWEKRYSTMKLHAASHIVEHFLFEVFGKKERLGSKVDFKKDRSVYGSSEIFDPEQLQKAEQLCNDFFSANHKITTHPSKENENVREWACDKIKMLCGGTHPKNTSEIGKIRLKRVNKGSGKECVETFLI